MVFHLGKRKIRYEMVKFVSLVCWLIVWSTTCELSNYFNGQWYQKIFLGAWIGGEITSQTVIWYLGKFLQTFLSFSFFFNHSLELGHHQHVLCTLTMWRWEFFCWLNFVIKVLHVYLCTCSQCIRLPPLSAHYFNWWFIYPLTLFVDFCVGPC